MEREDNICTLSERLSKIECELARINKIVEVLHAEYNVKHIDEQRDLGVWYVLE